MIGCFIIYKINTSLKYLIYIIKIISQLALKTASDLRAVTFSVKRDSKILAINHLHSQRNNNKSACSIEEVF